MAQEVKSEGTYDSIIVEKIPDGVPKADEHFKILRNQKLGAVGDDDVLIELHYMSVDPYLRSRLKTWVGKPVVSGCLCKILKIGKNVKNVAVGDYCTSYVGWNTKSIIPAKGLYPIKDYVKREASDDNKNNNNNDESKENKSKIELSYYIGGYGMPGMTAWYGLNERIEFKKTDTILISAGAGAVGSIAGQLAKVNGNPIIVGTAGSDDKCKRMTERYGFTHAFNYKTYKTVDEMKAKLKEAFGDKGIDVYFDMTGGHVTHAVWDLLNFRARVIICGQISMYNNKEAPLVRDFLAKLIYNEGEIKGLSVNNCSRKMDFFKEFGQLLNEGKVVLDETLVEGFDSTPQAFCDLFVGKNTGKMIVDVFGVRTKNQAK